MGINTDRGDLFICGFWDRNIDCIIDVCICDVHQVSYQTRKPASITKSVENDEKGNTWSNALHREGISLLSLYHVKDSLEKR